MGHFNSYHILDFIDFVHDTPPMLGTIICHIMYNYFVVSLLNHWLLLLLPLIPLVYIPLHFDPPISN